MKSTRDLVLDLLRQHGELTVGGLVASLGIAQPAVRRHLDILAGEALVQHRAVKQPVGRPYFVYSLSERAQEQASQGYSRLVERLLHELISLDAGDTSGRRVVEAVLDRMSDHIADEHRGRIHGETLEERVASLVLALADEGILDDFEVQDDGIHLINTTCPHRRAALTSTALCRSEERAITNLLGVPVKQTGRIAAGQARCEYVISLGSAAMQSAAGRVEDPIPA